MDYDRTNANAARMRLWRVILAVLCIGLVALGTTVQVAHSHLDKDASHADCSLCVIAHVGAEAVPAPVTLAVATFVSLIETTSPVTRPAAVLTFALFTRPPPADVVLA